MARDAQGSVAHRMGTAKLSHLTLLIALEVNTVNKLRPREFRHEGETNRWRRDLNPDLLFHVSQF